MFRLIWLGTSRRLPALLLWLNAQLILLVGILITNHNSPPITTPLEPCRVAPYVNVPASIRTTSVNTSTSSPSTYPTSATFSAFDPALLTAAHQVSGWADLKTNSLIYLLFTFSVCSGGNQQRQPGPKSLLFTSVSTQSRHGTRHGAQQELEHRRSPIESSQLRRGARSRESRVIFHFSSCAALKLSSHVKTVRVFFQFLFPFRLWVNKKKKRL